MYIIMAFMGSDLAGAMAISQAFLILRVSVSWGEGALEGVVWRREDCELVSVGDGAREGRDGPWRRESRCSLVGWGGWTLMLALEGWRVGGPSRVLRAVRRMLRP